MSIILCNKREKINTIHTVYHVSYTCCSSWYLLRTNRRDLIESVPKQKLPFERAMLWNPLSQESKFRHFLVQKVKIIKELWFELHLKTLNSEIRWLTRDSDLHKVSFMIISIAVGTLEKGMIRNGTYRYHLLLFDMWFNHNENGHNNSNTTNYCQSYSAAEIRQLSRRRLETRPWDATRRVSAVLSEHWWEKLMVYTHWFILATILIGDAFISSNTVHMHLSLW